MHPTTLWCCQPLQSVQITVCTVLSFPLQCVISCDNCYAYTRVSIRSSVMPALIANGKLALETSAADLLSMLPGSHDCDPVIDASCTMWLPVKCSFQQTHAIYLSKDRVSCSFALANAFENVCIGTAILFSASDQAILKLRSN